MVSTDQNENTFKSEDLTVQSALQQIFRTSRNHNKLAIGSKEVIKSLYRVQDKDDVNKLKLIVMAKDGVSEIKIIIEDKCKQLDIPMIYIETNEELGNMAPIKNTKKMSVIGIRDFICESREKLFLKKAFNY